MTTLINLTNKQVIISRLTTVSGNRRAYVTTTAAMSEIQPLSPAKTQLVEGVMGKTYHIFTESTADIQESDKLREVSTSKVFKVKTGGVSRRTMGSMDFLAVIVEQMN